MQFNIKSRLQFLTTRLLGVLIAIFFLSSCSHYHLGSKALPFNSLYIEPVHNKSLAPQVQAPLTAQLRQVFLRNTELTLKNEDHADVTLETTITNYSKSAAATRENDTTIARAFSINITAECTLTNNKTGEVLFTKRSISTSINATTDGSFQESEYRAITALTEDLALQIKSLVVSVW